MNEWEETGQKLAVLILLTLSRICYKIAEFFGRIGLKCEFVYRQIVTA